jgi:hypothetical protein
VVDFHGEATSEKQAMGFFCDGRASLVVGTHTHIPTADHRILGGGTAYMTDAGMTGDYDSVIGMDHGRTFTIQEHHAPQGEAGRHAVQALRQAVARNHRRRQDGHARPGDESAPARRRSRRPRREHAEGQHRARDQEGLGGEGENYEEIRYEGYGPGGTAVIVEALTDNRNRTASDVRSFFTKSGGNLAETGAVSFMFDRVGTIEFDAAKASADDMLEAAIEAGADDVVSSEEATRSMHSPPMRSTRSPRRWRRSSASRRRRR